MHQGGPLGFARRVRLLRLTCRGANGPVPREMTQCMVRPCVARGFSSICRLCGLASITHQCIRPLVGACRAPGHHGYQRADVLISGQTSNGPFGSPGFACAVKTDPPSRLILSQTSAGNSDAVLHYCYLPFRCSSFVRAIRAVPSSRPAVAAGHRAQGCQDWPLCAATRRAWS